MSLHGSAVTTLIDSAKKYSSYLLVVKDSNDAVFGAFITEKLKVSCTLFMFIFYVLLRVDAIILT